MLFALESPRKQLTTAKPMNTSQILVIPIKEELNTEPEKLFGYVLMHVLSDSSTTCCLRNSTAHPKRHIKHNQHLQSFTLGII
jgi:hypothetical protein